MKRLILLLSVLFMLCSCANKAMTRYETLAPTYEKKGIEATIKQIDKEKKDLYGEKSAFLYHFDLGTLYHYKGDYQKSIEHFEKAEKVYDELFTRSVTNEAAAVLTNDNVRPYRARPFEIIVMHQYQIMNYLAQKNVEDALVEVKRAQIALDALYQKDNDKVNDNGFLRYLCGIVYEMAGEDDDAAIAYIKAAKAFKEGNVDMPKEVWEFICEYLTRVGRTADISSLGYKPVSSTPKADDVRKMGQEIVLVGYAGHSPILTEMKMSGTFVSGGSMYLSAKDGASGGRASISVSAPIIPNAGSETFHISVAFPEKKVLRQKAHHFFAKVDNSLKAMPERVMDVDAELTKNMDEETPNTLLRTAIRVVTRTVAAQIAKEKTQTGNGLFDLVKNVGVDVAQSQLEQADLRIGLFMPNYMYITRIPVEAGEHSLNVKAIDRNNQPVDDFNFNKVKVEKGQKRFLFVPAID